jgi:hypothetical protein
MAHLFPGAVAGGNVVTALEVNPKASDGGANLFGGEDDMVLSAQWLG